MMKIKDNFTRLLLLLLITFVACIGLYGLPSTMLGYKIKKVDLFSDIRVVPQVATMDSLRAQLEQPVDVPVEVDDTPTSTLSADSARISSARRDSISKLMNSMQTADPQGLHIEDYSADHTGLQRFFKALSNSHSRPVRIGFMGDSFIEGDIVVADLRNAMQQKFGGRGVGFVPVSSVSAQYRPTINQKEKGWKMRSIIQDKSLPYTISGMLFETTGDEASLSFQTVPLYAALRKVSTLKFLYDRNEETVMQLAYNADIVVKILPPTQTITQYSLSADSITSGSFTFINAKGFRALGLALEDNTGVIVDNFALRGNSGLPFGQLDAEVCRTFNDIRPYDLIILQYGLNVASEDMLDYNWYRSRMADVIRHLQQCFPETDFLLLGVSDRGNQYDGNFSTMPSVLALLNTQRQIAKQTQIPFWNMFGGMGGENSIVKYVNNGWAGKDYTHLNFRGGREVAKSLMNALMLEKELYNEMEND
ncbi:hypothetical protein AGMMS49574_05960 [Bacteroidia bacterium]|nr:hypothetical protein AGMMS49574_05960 [Bacteroidia bacterium]